MKWYYWELYHPRRADILMDCGQFRAETDVEAANKFGLNIRPFVKLYIDAIEPTTENPYTQCVV